MKKLPKIWLDVLLTLVCALLLGVVLSIFQSPPYLNAFLAAAPLLWLAFFSGVRLWRALSRSRTLAILLLLTFSLRVVTGVALFQVLPAGGYDSQVQDAGYVYADAYARDTDAFTLASNGEPLLTAFTGKFSSDQYGGLLSLSSLVYRVLSPDTARPLLITLLASAAMTFGLAFLYTGIRKRWGEKAALAAGLLYALYPEGVLLGSSQMREPFLIGLFSIGMWAILVGHRRSFKFWTVLALTVIFGLFISFPFGLMLAVLVAGHFLFVTVTGLDNKKHRVLGLAGLCAIGIAAAIGGWLWLRPVIAYDAYLTQANSGWISMLMNRYGERWNVPFVTVYGLTQPLLPAAIIDRSLPVWVVIAILRALGWFFAVPFLLYAGGAVWKVKNEGDKWLLVLLTAAMLSWVVITSLRAGGDQWDNPRYRAILIPWLAVIFAWSWQRLKEGRAPWFYRILACEAIFNVILLLWYVERYYIGDIKITVEWYFALILVACAGVVLGGLVFDFLKRKRSALSGTEQGAGSADLD